MNLDSVESLDSENRAELIEITSDLYDAAQELNTIATFYEEDVLGDWPEGECVGEEKVIEWAEELAEIMDSFEDEDGQMAMDRVI